ncbi:MAG: hypothetical protein E7588_03240 [Ruminococcaceae bacterium]|nr:hypothetical protein [Oscillospiraceae bacterium]
MVWPHELIGALMMAAFLMVLAMLGWYIYKIIRYFCKKNECRTAFFNEKSVFIISGILLLAVFLMRYAVSLYVVRSPERDAVVSTWWEELFSSVVASLQTFSMDADYEGYMQSLKQASLYAFGREWMCVGFRIFASVLNIISPIAGGAIILDVLVNIFPKLKVWCIMKFSRRMRCYFSELNSRSAVLASSLSENNADSPKPLIIFTDAYHDDESEKSSELIKTAKSMGAICLQDDILHVKKKKNIENKYFLIDEQEINNLHTLTKMADGKDVGYLKNSEIFMFSQDDSYVLAEKSFIEMLSSRLEEGEMPSVTPAQCYRKLACNLLQKVPLYQPLIHRRKPGLNTDLNVTVFGTGSIGTEVLTGTYWCGQVLDSKLRINVVANETKEDFEGRLNRINCDIIKSATENDPILVKNKRGEFSNPYCSFSFFGADVRFENIPQLLEKKNKDGISLLDTDYFVVALGSDELNLTVADALRREIGKYHLESAHNKKTVIAYAIYDTEMCKALNNARLFTSSKMFYPDIYMYAFGSMGEMYSAGNVLSPELSIKADSLDEKYNFAADAEKRAKSNKKRTRDDYTFWANSARAVHIPYKMFSCGMATASVFDEKDYDTYLEALKKDYQKYESFAKGDLVVTEDAWMRHRLAWLEHRRWNAFMRVSGFRFTDMYVHYYKEFGTHKSLSLKLHPCLVECDESEMKLELTEKGEPIDRVADGTKTEALDMLDEISLKMREVKMEKNKKEEKEENKDYSYYDFKKYDYPFYDF